MQKVIVLLLLMAGYFFYSHVGPAQKYDKAITQTLATLKGFGPGSKVRIFSLDMPITYTLIEKLKMRGIEYEFIDVNRIKGQSFQNMQVETNLDDIPVYPAMKSRGLVDPKGFSLPVIGFSNGEGLPYEAFNTFLKTIPITDMHPGKKKPYITVYGTNVCAYTAKTVQQLKEKNIPFEFLDLNSKPEHMGQVDARIGESGNTFLGRDLPFVEVNGNVLSRPSLQEIESRLLH